MCLSRDASATMRLVDKLVERGWSRRAAWQKAESWQRMTIWSEQARRRALARDAAYCEMATDSDPRDILEDGSGRAGIGSTRE